MRPSRHTLLTRGIAAGALIAYGGVLAALLTNSRALEALGWGVTFAGLGLILTQVIELRLESPTEHPVVEIIEGQAELIKLFEEMRHTPGLQSIGATWTVRYPAVQAYFAREASFLSEIPHVRFERLVSSAVVDEETRKDLLRVVADHPNLSLWETDPTAFECYICEYIHDLSLQMKVVLVLPEVAGGAARLGLYIDSERTPLLLGVAYAIQQWFSRLPRHRFDRSEP